MTKATIRLTAMASMSGALTNYLLGMLVMKGENPIPNAKEHFKKISERTIDNVLEIAGEDGCKLTKAELTSLQDLATSYKLTFKLVE